MNKSSQDRRQFLKNSSLAAFALSILPASSLSANSKPDDKVLNGVCNKTTTDYYGAGPFYTPDAPMVKDQLLASAAENGVRLILSGRVMNLDCTQIIPNTIIDIWHANHAGQYDNSGYNLRGITKTNDQGFYLFETILPGKYLNGNKFRPAHIHFKITPPGFDDLITQLYFEGDEEIPGDAAASINSGENDATERIIPLTLNGDNKMEGTWDIMINGQGLINSTQDLHVDKGMIYSVSPNPHSDSLEINYGVFRNAKISLLVYDMNGREVAILEEQKLSPNKYTAIWNPDSELPDGYYFISLKVNDLQVHYKKIVRKR